MVFNDLTVVSEVAILMGLQAKILHFLRVPLNYPGQPSNTLCESSGNTSAPLAL